MGIYRALTKRAVSTDERECPERFPPTRQEESSLVRTKSTSGDQVEPGVSEDLNGREETLALTPEKEALRSTSKIGHLLLTKTSGDEGCQGGW